MDELPNRISRPLFYKPSYFGNRLLAVLGFILVAIGILGLCLSCFACAFN